MTKLLGARLVRKSQPYRRLTLSVAATLSLLVMSSVPPYAQHNCKGEIEIHKVVPKPGVFVNTHKIRQKPNTYAPMVYRLGSAYTLERRLDGQPTLAKCRKLALHCSRGRHRQKGVRAYCVKTNSKGKFIKAYRLK